MRDLMTLELHFHVFTFIHGYTSCVRKVARQSIQGHVSINIDTHVLYTQSLMNY